MRAFGLRIISEVFTKTVSKVKLLNFNEKLILGVIALFSGFSGLLSCSAIFYKTMPNILNLADVRIADEFFSFNAEIVLISLFFILSLVFGVILLYFHSFSLLLLFDAVKMKVINFRKSLKKFGEEAHSLFKFKALLMLIIGLFIPLLVFSWTNLLLNAGIFELIFNFFAFLILFLIVAVFLYVLNFLLEAFIIPLMFFRRINFLSAFQEFLNLWGKNKAEIIFMFLVTVILEFVVNILVLIISFAFVSLSGLVLMPFFYLLSYVPAIIVLLFFLFFTLAGFWIINVFCVPLAFFKANFFMTFIGKIHKRIKY